MVTPDRPTYDLATIKRLVANNAWTMTDTAARDMTAMQLNTDDVRACIQMLDDRPLNQGGHFHKTMPSDKVPGTFQDVYYVTYCAQPLYVKLNRGRKGALVISFKPDERHE